MALAQFIPKQFQITLAPEEMLELILQLRFDSKEFDIADKLDEMLSVFEEAYGYENLPPEEDEVDTERPEGGVGRPPGTEKGRQEGPQSLRPHPRPGDGPAEPVG